MTEEVERPKKRPIEGQVTLTQMLKALDKDVATGIEKRLKRLSKKKAVTAPLDEHKVAQLERKEAYEEVSKEISKWDPIVDDNRKAKQLSFPLDREPDFLPTTADTIELVEPRNELERDVQAIIDENKAQMQKQKELTKAEEKYLKAISVDEAKERHQEMAKMRVKLSTYAAKMRRQKAIKSKSYRRLLKRERIRNHISKVESDGDALLDEIERLQKMRAQERASLKHKNTGKWAKHAKFRAKYDEEARNAMLEQIGIASRLLEKPAPADSDDESEDDDEEIYHSDEDDSENEVKDKNEEISDVSSADEDDESSADKDGEGEKESQQKRASSSAPSRLIISTESIDYQSKRRNRRRRSSVGDDEAELDATAGDGDDNGAENEDDEDEDEEQRKLMSEAFADDDVVGEFKKIKDQMADEEQPKDIDTYLPGWGDWAGPGIKVNKRKKKKYLIKAKRVKRKDESLGNVIISERANEVMKELQPKQLPRGFRSDKHLRKVLTQPTTGAFINQSAHRDAVRPRIQTRMGQRIEPISKDGLRGSSKAEWS